MKHLCIYIDNLERLRFFNALISALAHPSLQVTLLTSRLSVKWRASLAGLPCILCRRDALTFNRAPELGNSLDVMAGWLSLASAEQLYSAVYGAASSVHRLHSIDYLFIWNGTRTPGLALKHMAEREAIKTLYFEIANLPGKIFVDPLGVNAQSRFATLTSFPSNDGIVRTYRMWRSKFIEQKRLAGRPPQALLADRLNFAFIIDLAGSVLLRLPSNNDTPVYIRLKKFLTRPSSQKQAVSELPDEPFFFFPLQVSNDSQILINSAISQEEALRRCADVADRRGFKLVGKLHPAETDSQFVSGVIRLCSDLGVHLTDAPSMECLDKCEMVYTINSTVGLEAKILGKPVRHLAPAIYSRLETDSDLAYYTQQYLIDFDYFSGLSNEKSLWERLVAAANG